jgi:hypothetical protein
MLRWPRESGMLPVSPSIHIEGHDDWDLTTADGGRVPVVKCECGWTSESESFDQLAKDVLDHLRPLLDQGKA